MLALDKCTWERLSDKEKIASLIDELKSIKHRSEVFYKEGKGSRPSASAVGACSYITEEINGLLKFIDFN